MLLQIDATTQYALGYDKETKSWWKRPITLEDLAIDSPYNTYVREGLPIGPVSNPGIAAINAVLDADPNTEFIFYVNDANGRLHFARTNEEHEANVEKYQGPR